MTRSELPLADHLAELRRRLLVGLLAILGGTIASYLLVDRIVDLVVLPAGGIRFVYLAPPDLFVAYIRLSVAAGLVLVAPFLLAQVWLFVAPGLTRGEKAGLVLILTAGSLFFAGGVVFAYLVLLPTMMEFFRGFSRDDVLPLYSFGEYVGFVSSTLLLTGLSFEFPVVAAAAARAELVTAADLRRFRRHAILGAFILAAVITPPDVVSQVILGIPLWGLFELGLLSARAFQPKPPA